MCARARTRTCVRERAHGTPDERYYEKYKGAKEKARVQDDQRDFANIEQEKAVQRVTPDVRHRYEKIKDAEEEVRELSDQRDLASKEQEAAAQRADCATRQIARIADCLSVGDRERLLCVLALPHLDYAQSTLALPPIPPRPPRRAVTWPVAACVKCGEGEHDGDDH